MKTHEKILVYIGIIAVLIGSSYLSGYTRSNRQRTSEVGSLRTQFESELKAERDRNSELERLHEKDGIIIGNLRNDNSELRTENNILRAELGKQNGFIENLGGILEQDRDTIESILELIRELREAIRLHKEGLNSISGPDPD